jgi:hypothetical protein
MTKNKQNWQRGSWSPLSELLDKFCFFHKVGLHDQCPHPLLHEEKTTTYPGFELGIFEFQVGNVTNSINYGRKTSISAILKIIAIFKT